MFSFNVKKNKQNKKKSKKAQKDEESKTAFRKIDVFYKELHSMNNELKEITEHNTVFTNPNKKQRSKIADLNIFQQQISYIIETVNKLEDNYGLRKLEFDVKKIWPVESLESSCILEICHQIQSFMEKYDLSIMKIKSKIHLQSPGNVGAAKGNCNNCINAKENEEKIPSAPIIKEDENQVISEDPYEAAKVLNWRLSGFYQELSEIENGIYIVEYDEMPTAISPREEYSEKSLTDLEELVKSGNHLNYFVNSLVEVNKRICLLYTSTSPRD